MNFPARYLSIKRNEWTTGDYKLTPIRYQDRELIRKWRNEQIFHLRQAQPLTKEAQDTYFQTVVAALFHTEKPSQYLFSFFKNDELIGYGGLVHINWIDNNAEISFIINTELEKDFFEESWVNYLHLLQKVAFEELNLHKIYTYAFDIRPKLYPALLKAGFREEARMPEHCRIDGNYRDVVFHSIINRIVHFRKPTIQDAKLYFDWANDDEVRKFSYSSQKISYDTHIQWFTQKLNDKNCHFYLFMNHDEKPIGQVRIQQADNEAVIGISIAKEARGKGFASNILTVASDDFLQKNKDCRINAYIKIENEASLHIFEKAGFKTLETLEYEGFLSKHYVKQ